MRVAGLRVLPQLRIKRPASVEKLLDLLARARLHIGLKLLELDFAVAVLIEADTRSNEVKAALSSEAGEADDDSATLNFSLSL